MASQLEKMKKKGRAKEGLSQSARNTGVGIDSRYGSGNMMLINIDLLEENEKNNREVIEDDEGIQSLMRSIADVGLQQNLVVYQIGGGEEKRFRLLSGHRRLFALKKLHEAEPDNEKYRMIPCLIVALNGDEEKDISLELEEQMYIAVTNVEMEGLTRKELLNSVKVCMTYYSKKHRGEKKIAGKIKEETSGKLGISQRMLYDILKIDGGLIPVFHRAYFEDNTLQHRAARMLAGYDEKIQEEIYQCMDGDIENLGEERISAILSLKGKKRTKKKTSTDPTETKDNQNNTALVYDEISDLGLAKRIKKDERGKRLFATPKGMMATGGINPKKDLEIIMPQNLNQKGLSLSSERYKKYIKAMNSISKEMAVIADLLENRE